MLGIDYGSDSEDDSTSSSATQKPATTAATAGPSSVAAKLALPPPSKPSLPASKASGSSISLPPPKTKKPAKKILVELPKLSKHASDDEDDGDRPALKKPRLNGAGGGKASALLSMLPAPKKSTLELPKAERVLGGGGRGLVFSRQSGEVAPIATDSGKEVIEEDSAPYSKDDNDEEDVQPEKDTTTSMIPPSMLLKGKGKAATKPPAPASSAPESAVDFFSLASTSSSRISSVPRLASPPASLSSTPSLSAAPKVEEFTPPSPKPDDPYPGYYQLPSGAWAMHDPGYYKSHYDRWQKEYEAQIRAYEKSHPSAQRGFEGAVGACNGAGLEEISATDLADQARKEREDKKQLTEGAKREGERAMPRMTVNPSKMTGVARSRHQLGTMLMEAYMNREVLEEKIAQGKRNRKEAGNKYGF